MKAGAAVALGIGVGFLAARLLMEPSNCCARVSNAVRDEVGEKLGGWAQTTGDILGIWDLAPGLLNLFGVK